jgi:Tol biopolymer transport system component
VLLTLALGAALAAFVALAGMAREAHAAFPGNNGKIAFASTRTTGEGVNNPEGDFEIFTMKPDGTELKQLTSNNAEDSLPSFAADGSEVAFTSNRDGNYEIYVMDSDGSNQTRLTNNTGLDAFPTISPDKSRIAYQSDRGGNSEIIVQVAGFEINVTNNAANDNHPAFSPDGTKIAFTRSQQDGNS